MVFSETLNASATWEFDGSSLLADSEIGYLRLNYNSGSPRFTTYTGNATTAIVNVNLYVSTDSVKTSTLGADTFAYRYLHMRDYNSNLGYCSDNDHHYYLDAKAAYNALTADEKNQFASLTEAKARYEKWAEINKDGAPYDGNNSVVTPLKADNLEIISDNNSSLISIIVIVSLVSLTAVGGYFLLRKKKEQ